MRTMTIKAKVVLATLCCLGVGCILLLTVLELAYRRAVQSITEGSLARSRSAWAALQASEVARMSAAAELVMANPSVRDSLARRDRDALIEATAPLFTRLSEAYGIGILNFIDSEERGFVTMSSPNDMNLVGERTGHFEIGEAAKTKAPASGIALERSRLVLRVAHPFYSTDARMGARLLGYLESGCEVEGVLDRLKKQTGNEYGVVISKESLNNQQWAAERKRLGLRDNWADRPWMVVGSSTTDGARLFEYTGQLAALPHEGLPLDVLHEESAVRARAIFPLYDASGHKAAALFVLVDVTQVHANLRQMRSLTLAALAGLFTALSLLLTSLLNRLVFRRLDEITRVGTRLVGGDLHATLAVSTHDEMSRFETFFEQLRIVFVDLVQDHETSMRDIPPSSTTMESASRASCKSCGILHY